jgi:hypothetical protein
VGKLKRSADVLLVLAFLLCFGIRLASYVLGPAAIPEMSEVSAA